MVAFGSMIVTDRVGSLLIRAANNPSVFTILTLLD